MYCWVCQTYPILCGTHRCSYIEKLENKENINKKCSIELDLRRNIAFLRQHEQCDVYNTKDLKLLSVPKRFA